MERDDSLRIDIEGNGVDDLKIMNTSQYQGVDAINDSILLSFGKCTGGSGCPEADTIAFGEVIGLDQEWYLGFWLWQDKIEYLGVKMNKDSSNFGWIKIKIDADVIIIKEYFFSKDAERVVRAGLVG